MYKSLLERHIVFGLLALLALNQAHALLDECEGSITRCSLLDPCSLLIVALLSVR